MKAPKPNVVVAAAAQAVTTSVNTTKADEPAPSEHAWRFERSATSRASVCDRSAIRRVGSTRIDLEMGRAMERVKNAGLVFCLFVVLLVIFSSYFRANELGTLFGALAGTPVLVHVFNRLAPRRRDSHRGWTRQESEWRGPSRCCDRRSRCWYFAWKAQMGSDEISEKNVEAVTEANLRRWMQVVACMIVIADVCGVVCNMVRGNSGKSLDSGDRGYVEAAVTFEVLCELPRKEGAMTVARKASCSGRIAFSSTASSSPVAGGRLGLSVGSASLDGLLRSRLGYVGSPNMDGSEEKNTYTWARRSWPAVRRLMADFTLRHSGIGPRSTV